MSWIGGNRYLSRSEMENNATEIWGYFNSIGWSLNSVSAMLGNMQTESTINPNIWQGLIENTKKGYGLTQWTPATKLIDWAGSSYIYGNRQCDRIYFEALNNKQWFRNPEAPIIDPPITFLEFTVSTLECEELANYFLWYYEHPETTIQPNRSVQAREWFNFLGGITPPDPPEPPSPDPTPLGKYRHIPIWMMCGRRRF